MLFRSVEAARAVGPDARHAVLAQHSEVLRDSGLGDTELTLDHCADSSRRLLTISEQLDDASTHRVSEDLKRVHHGALYRVVLI